MTLAEVQERITQLRRELGYPSDTGSLRSKWAEEADELYWVIGGQRELLL